MPTATISSKGQVTIPREVREDLGVTTGDRLAFVRMEDGNYAVMPASHSVKALKGIIPKPKKPVSLGAMEQAIRTRATRK